MNFHTDEWIYEQVRHHYDEALKHFNRSNIVGIFLQGSQNYGLDYEGSDIDTKLIITPTLNDLIYNKQPVSTTHIRENNEHIDFKDVRLYMKTFEKQNLNFLEILFTPYFVIPSYYYDEWMRLVEHREKVARLNPYLAVKAMKGVAHNKYAALQHRYEGKIEILEKYGYDSKQLHHIKRVEDYLERYIAGEKYEDCLHPKDTQFLQDIKFNKYPVEKAIAMADSAIEHIDNMANKYCENVENKNNTKTLELIKDVQANIIKRSIEIELKEGK